MKTNQTIPSRLARVIPSDVWKQYREANPKPQSKRDKHRAKVRFNKSR